jgi:hypothetical protein
LVLPTCLSPLDPPAFAQPTRRSRFASSPLARPDSDDIASNLSILCHPSLSPFLATTTTPNKPNTMSPSYASATAAWTPQSQAEQPHPDLNLLEGDAASSGSKTDGSEGITLVGKQTLEFTPPLTPTPSSGAGSERGESRERGGAESEASQGGLRQRQKGGEAKEKKKLPGAGFAQSLPGDITEQRPMREDLGELLDSPCTSSPFSLSPSRPCSAPSSF